MHFNVLNRKIHYWVSFAAAIPVLIIIATGVLLQTKKQWDWVQPPEQRGSVKEPIVSFERILASVQSAPDLDVKSWDDVDKLDVRPGKGIVKVTLKSGWEAQVDLGNGALLQTAYRRSDLIEQIHDGSFFAGDWTKLGLFLPAGITLLVLWLSGIWMVWVPLAAKRRRKVQVQRKAAVLAVLLVPVALSAQAPLSVDPFVGHWESATDNGADVVIADARKWQTTPAQAPFPVAAVRGVESFSDGVLSVRFKLVAGESDQIAGLAFGMADGAKTYYFARYNTKDGNVAIWRFDGARHRVAEGKEHAQLPMNAWHDLRVEIAGNRIVATVNNQLRVEHTLEAPVSGRVGFWTKRDSVTAFKDFAAKPARR